MMDWIEDKPAHQLELFPESTTWSETTMDDHIHECECGTWLCSDELCEPSYRQRYGFKDHGLRLCPMCDEMEDM